jgi:hypothetical protein
LADWITGLLTANRPAVTIDKTLESLALAGFPPPIVYYDVEHHGQFAPWLNLVKYTYNLAPNKDVYFFVEDDISMCRNVKEYIEKTACLTDPKTFIISPYCPEVFTIKNVCWHEEQIRGNNVTGGLAWAMPNHAIKNMFDNIEYILTHLHQTCGDRTLGGFAKAFGYKIYYHSPSLVQHIGLKNSAIKDDRVNNWRQASDYVGDNFNAMHLIDKTQSATVQTELEQMQQLTNSPVCEKCKRCGHLENGRCTVHTKEMWKKIVDSGMCFAYYVDLDRRAVD